MVALSGLWNSIQSWLFPTLEDQLGEKLSEKWIKTHPIRALDQEYQETDQGKEAVARIYRSQVHEELSKHYPLEYLPKPNMDKSI